MDTNEDCNYCTYNLISQAACGQSQTILKRKSYQSKTAFDNHLIQFISCYLLKLLILRAYIIEHLFPKNVS